MERYDGKDRDIMNKANKAKRVVAVMLLSTMIFGGVMTVHAEACQHNSYAVYTYTSTTGSTTQQYITETRHNPDGTITYIYGLCTITGCIDHYKYICLKCGAQTGTSQSPVYSRHSSCGA